jgi:hypothetical protein
MDKRRFLGVFVAALLMILAPVLNGCGGSKDDWGREDSRYPGSYYGDADDPNGSVGWFVTNGRSVDTGDLSFTINQKGEAIGEIVSSNGVVGRLTGKFDNNGLFHGTITRNGEVATFSGHFARQGLFVTDPESTTTPPGTTSLPGLTGDFRQVVNGVEFTGVFGAAGGNIITGGTTE